MRADVRRGRTAFGFTLVAVIYSAGLLAWVAAAGTSDGDTLLERGGVLTLAIFAQPLLMSLLLWVLLRRRCTTGSVGASLAARTLAGLFLVYSVLGGLTIAAGAMPAALALAFAAGLTPRGPAPLRPAGDPGA